MKPNLGKKPYREKAALDFMCSFLLVGFAGLETSSLYWRDKSFDFHYWGCSRLSIICSISFFALALAGIGIS